MEVKQLMPIVLLLLLTSMLIGVGVLTHDKFSRTVRTTTTVTEGDLNSSGSIALSNTYCLSVTGVIQNNGTVYPTGNVTFSDADSCTATATLSDSILYNVTYTYGADAPAQTAIDGVRDAISGIATSWMALIVTILVLSIILVMVIRSFGRT